MSIAMTVELPESIAEKLGKSDLPRTALEAIALEGYRLNRLTGASGALRKQIETGALFKPNEARAVGLNSGADK